MANITLSVGDIVTCDKYRYALILDNEKMLVCVESQTVHGRPLVPEIVDFEDDIFPFNPNLIREMPWSFMVIFSTALIMLKKPTLYTKNPDEK